MNVVVSPIGGSVKCRMGNDTSSRNPMLPRASMAKAILRPRQVRPGEMPGALFIAALGLPLLTRRRRVR